jgi:hypothetical protein
VDDARGHPTEQALRLEGWHRTGRAQSQPDDSLLDLMQLAIDVSIGTCVEVSLLLIIGCRRRHDDDGWDRMDGTAASLRTRSMRCVPSPSGSTVPVTTTSGDASAIARSALRTCETAPWMTTFVSSPRRFTRS